MPLFRIHYGAARISLRAPEDFSMFYEQAHRSVFRYVIVLCAGNQDEAEDITAETFFRAWEKRGQFTGSQSAALGWTITIARNLLIDRRRSEGIHPAAGMLDEALTAPDGSIEEMLVDGEQLRSVLDSIASLPFPQGDIVTLRYVLGWQVKTIGEHLGITENNVSVHLRRALARLQRKLISQEAGEERAA